MYARRWTAASGRFEVRVVENAWKRLEALADSADPNETGGILVGHYAEAYRVAVVTEVSSAPSDSASGHSWFQRGRRGLAAWLGKLWSRKDRQYYLGEWHYHPSHFVEPSSADIAEIESIARRPEYACPEPILLIVGRPLQRERAAFALVAPRGARPEALTSTKSGLEVL